MKSRISHPTTRSFDSEVSRNPNPRRRSPAKNRSINSRTSAKPTQKPSPASARTVSDPGLGSGRQPIRRILPRPVLVTQLAGQRLRLLDQVAVLAELREAQVAPPRLTRPQQLARAAQLEV